MQKHLIDRLIKMDTWSEDLVFDVLSIVDAAEQLVSAPRGSPNAEGLGRARIKMRLERLAEWVD